MKSDIILYFDAGGSIGGIETFIYNFCMEFKEKYSISVLYREFMHPIQAARLIEDVSIMRYEEEKEYKCGTLIVNGVFCKPIPKNVKYNKKIQMIHGMKRDGTWKIPEGYDLLVPVADSVKMSFEGDFDPSKCQTIHNLTIPAKPKNVLRLISATRLTAEKGWERMKAFANMLNANEIPFIWTVFTKEEPKDAPGGMVFLPPTLNVAAYIPWYDYLVQLSDTEGYSYSIIESLELGVPVIVTPLPFLEEAEIKDGINSYILPFDMKNVDVKKIYEKIPKFTYKNKNEEIKKQWENVISPLKCDKKAKNGSYLCEVEVIIPFYDIELQEHIPVWHRYFVSPARARILAEKNIVNIIGVKEKEDN